LLSSRSVKIQRRTANLTGPIARRSSKARIRSGELFGEISATASPCSVKITRRAPCKTGRRTFRVCRRSWVRVASTSVNYTLYILLQLDPFVRTLFPVCYLLSPRPPCGRGLDFKKVRFNLTLCTRYSLAKARWFFPLNSGGRII
jgi:hypothetical protein